MPSSAGVSELKKLGPVLNSWHNLRWAGESGGDLVQRSARGPPPPRLHLQRSRQETF